MLCQVFSALLVVENLLHQNDTKTNEQTVDHWLFQLDQDSWPEKQILNDPKNIAEHKVTGLCRPMSVLEEMKCYHII